MKTLWTNARLATMAAVGTPEFVDNGALVTDGPLLQWADSAAGLPADLARNCAATIDLGGALVTPGLIDCHSLGSYEFSGNGKCFSEKDECDCRYL